MQTIRVEIGGFVEDAEVLLMGEGGWTALVHLPVNKQVAIARSRSRQNGNPRTKNGARYYEVDMIDAVVRPPAGFDLDYWLTLLTVAQ